MQPHPDSHHMLRFKRNTVHFKRIKWLWLSVNLLYWIQNTFICRNDITPNITPIHDKLRYFCPCHSFYNSSQERLKYWIWRLIFSLLLYSISKIDIFYVSDKNTLFHTASKPSYFEFTPLWHHFLHHFRDFRHFLFDSII